MRDVTVVRSAASPIVLFAAIVGLAALDFVGAVLAKEWAAGRNLWLFGAGLLTFALLLAVYAISLKLAELSTVTFGWIVCLQVGLLLFERFHYGVTLPAGKWVAIAVILALQAYLVLSPNDVAHGGRTRGHEHAIAASVDGSLLADVARSHGSAAAIGVERR
jgi:hypothetical protein